MLPLDIVLPLCYLLSFTSRTISRPHRKINLQIITIVQQILRLQIITIVEQINTIIANYNYSAAAQYPLTCACPTILNITLQICEIQCVQ